ncbi:MAG: MFS transporter [Desulfurococcales archaeon]|nr:MFS transporter [Desulfurococcales archaeon]
MKSNGANWSRLVALYAGLFMASIPAGLARPALAFHLRYDLGATAFATASLTSSFMGGRALASIASGFIGELAPGMKRLIIGLGVAGIGLFLLTVLPNLGEASTVVALTTVWGVLGGITWPTLQVAVAEMGRGRSGLALSIYYATASLGISLGNWLFGHLKIAYVEMLELAGAILILSSPVIALSVEPVWGTSGRRRLKRALTRVRDPIILWVIVSAFAIGILNGVLREYFYIYSHEVFGLTKASLGDVLSIAGVFSVLLSLTVGPLSDKYGIPRLLLVVLAITGIGGLLVGDPLGSVLILSTGYVLAAGGARSSLPLTRNAGIAGRIGGAMVVGASNMASSLGMLSGPPIAGFVYQHSPRYAGVPFIAASLFIFAVMIIYIAIVVMRSRKRTGYTS